MFMIEAFQPVDLHGAARLLGEHPFEVIRLMAVQRVPDTPTVPRHVIEQLRSVARIEMWWDGIDLPQDDNRVRAVARGILDAMLQRDCVGDRLTRRENLYRGLPADALEIGLNVVGTLVDRGVLHVERLPEGVFVSLSPSWIEDARALVTRGHASADIASLWQE
jgi:hypothetical protein